MSPGATTRLGVPVCSSAGSMRLGVSAPGRSSFPRVIPGSQPCTYGDIATHPYSGSTAESADAYYRKALALAEPRGMRPLLAHCHLGLGKLSRRTGKREQAHEHLATAATMYREMDMLFWLEKAETETKERG